MVINGVAVVGEQDFNVNVDVIERELRPPAQNSMTVTISSSPGSFIELAVLAPYGGRQAVDASGGTLQITNPESPIAGTELRIPAGAVDGDVNLAVTVNYADAPPAPVPPAATVVSKTIDFAATSDRKFNTPAAVKNIEQTAATTSFSTGFVPGVDSYRMFDVFGGPSTPSTANALYQLWYFTDKKAQTGVALAGKYAEGGTPDQGVTANELTQRLFTALAGTWQRVITAPATDSARLAADLWTGLAVTGQPQLLMWRRGVLSRAARYGRLRWDPTVRRLTQYKVGDGAWFDRAGVAAPGFGTFASGRDIEPFYAAAENEFRPAVYGTINVTSPILRAASSAYGFMSFSNQEALTVTGTVTPGGSIPAPTHIVPFIRGVRQQPVALGPGGTFTIALNVNNTISSWVALVATNTPNDEWALGVTLRNFAVNRINCRFPVVSKVRPNPLPAPNGPFQYISGLRVSGQNLQGAQIFTNGPLLLTGDTVVSSDGTVAERRYVIGCCGPVDGQPFEVFVSKACGSTGVTLSISKP